MQVVLSHMQVIGVYLKQSSLGIGKKTGLKKNSVLLHEAMKLTRRQAFDTIKCPQINVFLNQQ